MNKYAKIIELENTTYVKSIKSRTLESACIFIMHRICIFLFSLYTRRNWTLIVLRWGKFCDFMIVAWLSVRENRKKHNKGLAETEIEHQDFFNS